MMIMMMMMMMMTILIKKNYDKDKGHYFVNNNLSFHPHLPIFMIQQLNTQYIKSLSFLNHAF